MPDDTYYIKRTFELAQKGLGNVSPNPLAGAVIVRNKEIISEGYHKKAGMDYAEIATIIGAIGNHDEAEGQVVNHVTAALILADKSDVHRSRVRNQDIATFDIHDRVNYAVKNAELEVNTSSSMFSATASQQLGSWVISAAIWPCSCW